jgi:light-regulated signal transduction histidine kinase (bacteriophytochrome)
VVVYQFDETAAGSVVSEIVDPRASTDIYRGLKFPASDIPKQARDLYLINKIRVLYDRDQPTARLVCRTKEDAAVRWISHTLIYELCLPFTSSTWRI